MHSFEVIPLFSGSSGNAVYVRYKDREFLIDAGVSCRALCGALKKIGTDAERIAGIFVTHEHTDHVGGLETFCKRYGVPVYINSFSENALRTGGKAPCAVAGMRILEPGGDVFSACGLTAEAFWTPHDACGCVGYRFDSEDGDSFAYATDLGYVTRSIARHVLGAKTVILESNHDVDMLKNGCYPAALKRRILSDRGHLSNDDCARFVPSLASSGTRRIILAHLSAENNTPDKAYFASDSALRAAACVTVQLEVAKRSILDDPA